MGELIDYYIIEGVVEYTDDPLKIGRVQCSIPGVVHHSAGQTEEKGALPWVRPFKMYGYQTFSKPMQGQKVWVLASKSNYNEFWWFPFNETLDIVQGYLNEYYNENPDVFHARVNYAGSAMSTWDDKQGYKWLIGEDYIDFFPTREFKLKVNECNINITSGNIIEIGGDGAGEYEKAVKGEQLNTLLGKLKSACEAVAKKAEKDSHTLILLPELNKFADTFTSMEKTLLCEKCYVN